MLHALHAEADFYLLMPLAWLVQSRLATLHYSPGLLPTDLRNREREDLLRLLFSSERDTPELAPLHVGLTEVYAEQAGEQAADVVPLARPRAYSYLLEDLNPRPKLKAAGFPKPDSPAEGTTSLIVPSLAAFTKRFERLYPQLIAKLDDALAASGVPTSGPGGAAAQSAEQSVEQSGQPLCGWFIAGGAALRALQNYAVSDKLFAGSDVDVFIYSRGPQAAENATKLARAVCNELVPPSEPASEHRRRHRYYYHEDAENVIHRTLFTINISDESRQVASVSYPVHLFPLPSIPFRCLPFPSTAFHSLPPTGGVRQLPSSPLYYLIWPLLPSRLS